MLVLSRKQGESLCIGDDIHLTVLGVSGNQVRVGIKAPLDKKIHREEVYRRIKAEEENYHGDDHRRSTVR